MVTWRHIWGKYEVFTLLILTYFLIDRLKPLFKHIRSLIYSFNVHREVKIAFIEHDSLPSLHFVFCVRTRVIPLFFLWRTSIEFIKTTFLDLIRELYVGYKPLFLTERKQGKDIGWHHSLLCLKGGARWSLQKWTHDDRLLKVLKLFIELVQDLFVLNFNQVLVGYNLQIFVILLFIIEEYQDILMLLTNLALGIFYDTPLIRILNLKVAGTFRLLSAE